MAKPSEKIQEGILLLLGVEKEDDQAKADKLLDKVLKYRIFNDENGKMNLGLERYGWWFTGGFPVHSGS